MIDFERFAEACERAEQELRVKCLRCWEHPESMSMCAFCQTREIDATELATHARAIRAGRVTIEPEK